MTIRFDNDFQIGRWDSNEREFVELRELLPERDLGEILANSLRDVENYAGLRLFDTGELIVIRQANICNVFATRGGINHIIDDPDRFLLSNYIIKTEGGLIPSIDFRARKNQVIIRTYSLGIGDMVSAYDRDCIPLPWE